MTAALLAGLAAGYGIAVPVGAVGTYVVTVSARSGWRRGAFAALGVASADAVYAVLAAVGGAVLASAVRPLATPLRVASVVVLLAIAGVIAIGAVRERRNAAGPAQANADAARRMGVRSDLGAYLAFLGITLLNPLTIVYFAALIVGGQGQLFTSTADRAVFVAAATVASASWQLLLAGGGALLGQAITRPRGRLLTALISSVVIAALAIRLI